MDSDDARRRLTAILSADAVGYSRLMAQAEAETVRRINAYREQMAVLVRQHRGRVADARGDNLLAEFPSATDATACAVEIQRVLRARNADLPGDRKLEFRIGVHVGEVRVESDGIYGDGIHVAARLEGLAEPGGICVSEAVREQVGAKLDLDYDDRGEPPLKNIARPVRVFRVRVGDRPGDPARGSAAGSRLRTALLAALALVVALGLGTWLTWPRPLGLALDLAGVGGFPVEPAPPDEPSIVVLPFANLSADPEQEYFSDGMTEELTNALSRHSALFVISRSSAFTYKGKPVRVEDVGRELGVRYVVEGSVRKAENRIRVTAQLIDAESTFHLWSDQYDRELAGVFDVQSEIANEIVTALQVEVRDTELERAVHARTDDLRAYDALLRGWSEFERFTRDDNAEARRYFQRALELDPTFGAARAVLGNTYVVEYAMGWNRTPGSSSGRRAWRERRSKTIRRPSTRTSPSRTSTTPGASSRRPSRAPTGRSISTRTSTSPIPYAASPSSVRAAPCLRSNRCGARSASIRSRITPSRRQSSAPSTMRRGARSGPSSTGSRPGPPTRT